jgi:hypothetical protein
VSLSKDSRVIKKLKAARLAEFRLRQRFDYIDYVEDELGPEIAAVLAGKPVLGLEAGNVFTLELVDENADTDQA